MDTAQNFTDFLKSITRNKKGMSKEEALASFRQNQLNKIAMEKQQPQQAQQQGQQQNSGVDQALMAAFEKIMNM